MHDALAFSPRRALAIARCEFRAFHRQAAWRAGGALTLVLALALAWSARGDALRAAAAQDVVLLAFGFLGAALAMVLGADVVAREVRDRTWMVVLAKPVSRLEFLIGKFVGIAAVLAEVALTGAACLGSVMALAGGWGAPLFGLVAFSWLQWCMVAGLAVLFASVTSGPLALLYTVALFLLGHTGGLVRTFAESEVRLNALNHWGGTLFYYLVPHFEMLDQRAVLVDGQGEGLLAAAAAYALAMTSAWLGLASLAWRRREL